jgi:hypothetical protein
MVKTKILGKPGQPSFRGDVNQCPTCFTVFNSSKAFDKHRVGDFTARRCLSDDEMIKIGMGKNRYGRWVSSLMSADDLSKLRINVLKKELLQKNN